MLNNLLYLADIKTLPDCPPLRHVFSFVVFSIKTSPVLVTGEVLNALLSFFEITIFVGQIGGIMVNITTNESKNWRRYPYFTHQLYPIIVNPYAHGLKQSISDSSLIFKYFAYQN